MRDAYIVKKSVKRNPIVPKELISYEQFVNFVESTEKLTWYEETKFGKKSHERNPTLPKKHASYLNIDETDETSFVRVSYSVSGYISVRFDYKSTKENLLDLIDLANSIDCNLWRYKPKRQILTPEIVNNRNKSTKPRAKRQSELKPLADWIFFEGSLTKFQVVNRLEFKKSKSTYASINNGATKNSILALELESDAVFIIGQGIKNLYLPSIILKEKDNEVTLKEKFQNRMAKLFREVKFKSTSNADTIARLETIAMEALQEYIKNKKEIQIAKANQKLILK